MLPKAVLYHPLPCFKPLSITRARSTLVRSNYGLTTPCHPPIRHPDLRIVGEHCQRASLLFQLGNSGVLFAVPFITYPMPPEL